jgi:hypothetical protein
VVLSSGVLLLFSGTAPLLLEGDIFGLLVMLIWKKEGWCRKGEQLKRDRVV